MKQLPAEKLQHSESGQSGGRQMKQLPAEKFIEWL